LLVCGTDPSPVLRLLKKTPSQDTLSPREREALLESSIDIRQSTIVNQLFRQHLVVDLKRRLCHSLPGEFLSPCESLLNHLLS